MPWPLTRSRYVPVNSHFYLNSCFVSVFVSFNVTAEFETTCVLLLVLMCVFVIVFYVFDIPLRLWHYRSLSVEPRVKVACLYFNTIKYQPNVYWTYHVLQLQLEVTELNHSHLCFYWLDEMCLSLLFNYFDSTDLESVCSLNSGTWCDDSVLRSSVNMDPDCGFSVRLTQVSLTPSCSLRGHTCQTSALLLCEE